MICPRKLAVLKNTHVGQFSVIVTEVWRGKGPLGMTSKSSKATNGFHSKPAEHQDI